MGVNLHYSLPRNALLEKIPNSSNITPPQLSDFRHYPVGVLYDLLVTNETLPWRINVRCKVGKVVKRSLNLGLPKRACSTDQRRYKKYFYTIGEGSRSIEAPRPNYFSDVARRAYSTLRQYRQRWVIFFQTVQRFR